MGVVLLRLVYQPRLDKEAEMAAKKVKKMASRGGADRTEAAQARRTASRKSQYKPESWMYKVQNWSDSDGPSNSRIFMQQVRKDVRVQAEEANTETRRMKNQKYSRTASRRGKPSK